MADLAYGVLSDTHWWVQGRLRVLDEIVARRVPPGGWALDVGAGTGIWGTRLARRFRPVRLVEADPSLRAAIASAGVDPELVHDATLPGPLPFPDRSLQLVCCLDVLEHIPDDAASAAELARIVAPGGFVLISVPAHPHLWSRHDEAVDHQRRYTRAALEKLVVAAGLKITLLCPMNVWMYPVAAVLRRLDKVGDSTPGPLGNRILTAIFGSERLLFDRWPAFVRGLSWVCLARRP
ncbi:MAG: class I SAM-dependent methyltransferase [Actinomycetota bacterium]